MRGGENANQKHFPVLADSDYALHIINRQLPPQNIYIAALKVITTLPTRGVLWHT